MTPDRSVARGGVLVVGNRGGTNVGESLLQAALRRGSVAGIVAPSIAMRGARWVRAIYWHALGRRGPNEKGFHAALQEQVQRQRPEVIVVAGMAPLDTATLRMARDLGAVTAVFVTDDPWSPVHRAKRFLAAIGEYDLVLTPRRKTIPEFLRAGARRAEYLAFGYDRQLWFNPGHVAHGGGADVLFVGGGDRERAELLAPLLGAGVGVDIYGSYWPRGSAAARACRGQAGVETLREATKAAKVNLCLVRRSNRDEHVMRSYEAAAAGGCVLAEDTADHRSIYAETARYFRTGAELVQEVRRLLENEPLRRELAAAGERRVTEMGNTYDDRLEEILRMLGKTAMGEERG